MKFRLSLLIILVFCFNITYSQNNNFDSTKNGKFTQTQKNGLIVYGNFKNSKRHKIWTWYNVDGTLHKQIKYKNGKTIWILYFEKNKSWLKINRYGKRKVIRQCNCREQDY